MHDLKNEINELIDKLKCQQPLPGSVEARALGCLSRIAERALIFSDPRRLSAQFSELHQFWTNAVPWCSELSRDLEKLVVHYAQRLEAFDETD